MRFPEFSGEWERYRLDECVTFLDEKRKPIKSSDRVSEKGLYPYYGASGIIDRIDNFIFDDDLVLLSEDGANILDRNYRVAFIVRGKAWINNHAHVLKPNCHTDIVFLSESLERIDYAPYNTGTTMPKLNQEVCRGIMLYMPTPTEQAKIGSLLKLVNERIEAQSKIIEELTALRSALIEKCAKQSGNFYSLTDILQEMEERSTAPNQYQVLSSTVKGIFSQKEYFNKDIASEDNKGYKVVRRGHIVLSPQNLWMGNINYNDRFDIGIVSPSYKVFSIKEGFNPIFIAALLQTKKALNEYMLASEQGASIVRRNLNIEAFMAIKFRIPDARQQDSLSMAITAINAKLNNERCYLEQLTMQKSCLLENMFI